MLILANKQKYVVHSNTCISTNVATYSMYVQFNDNISYIKFKAQFVHHNAYSIAHCLLMA